MNIAESLSIVASAFTISDYMPDFMAETEQVDTVAIVEEIDEPRYMVPVIDLSVGTPVAPEGSYEDRTDIQNATNIQESTIERLEIEE